MLVADIGGQTGGPPVLASSAQRIISATSHGVLLTTFTDAGGLVTALNWAAHLARVGLVLAQKQPVTQAKSCPPGARFMSADTNMTSQATFGR